MTVHGRKGGFLSQSACGRSVGIDNMTADPSEITCYASGCRQLRPKVEQPRRITIVIAPATATHCGECPFLNDGTSPTSRRCDAFRAHIKGVPAMRLPICLAAEVKP